MTQKPDGIIIRIEFECNGVDLIDIGSPEGPLPIPIKKFKFS